MLYMIVTVQPCIPVDLSNHIRKAMSSWFDFAVEGPLTDAVELTSNPKGPSKV